MYEFIMNFINSAPHLVNLGHRQAEKQNNIHEPVAEPVVSKENSVIEKKSTNSREIEILSQEYGCLEEGMCIEIELNRILEILPRSRRRSDAYKGLRAKLKKLGVELVITSKRHHKN